MTKKTKKTRKNMTIKLDGSAIAVSDTSPGTDLGGGTRYSVINTGGSVATLTVLDSLAVTVGTIVLGAGERITLLKDTTDTVHVALTETVSATPIKTPVDWRS